MNKFLDFDFQESRFLDHLKDFSKEDQEKIFRACQLAKKSHFGQERNEGGSYVIHCLRVASYLIEHLNAKNPDIICAALLHDAAEDTDLKLNEIGRNFGPRVGELITNLTRKREGEIEANKYKRKYQKFLRLMEMDQETRMIKVCDWLDAICSWPHIQKDHSAREKFPRWFKEAETMYIPLAETVNRELVDKMKKALIKAKESYY